jgi:hypothetical protein
VTGACGGGLLAWNMTPPGWSLPFLTTLAASANAEKYGHLIEHTAQDIVVGVTFACVSCGVLSAVTTAAGTKVLVRLKHG